jgi:hypothetical protein
VLQPTGQVILTLSDHPRGETRDQEIRAVVWQQATQVCNQQDLSFRLLGDEFLQQAWEFYSFAKNPADKCAVEFGVQLMGSLYREVRIRSSGVQVTSQQ